MNKVASSMLFQGDGDWIAGAIIWMGILIVVLFTLMYFVWDPEWKADQAKEKALIDSLSCQALGKWVIDNSMNYLYPDGKVHDGLYPYAQAKYLVCTHSGVPPT